MAMMLASEKPTLEKAKATTVARMRMATDTAQSRSSSLGSCRRFAFWGR